MEELIGGAVHLHSYVDSWHVPRMFYRLVKVVMWRNDINTSGFEVTYERPDTAEFVGWPLSLTHMFGTVDPYKYPEEITLTKDLDSLAICIDHLNHENHADFEGFEFFEYDTDEAIVLSPKCPRN